MTIVSRTSAHGNTASFRPLVSRNLSEELAAILTEDIVSGRLAPGTRLPTEQELMVSFGVSRTVVREAISALRSEGLMATKQGVGVFVATDSQRRPFRIDPERLEQAPEVLKLMELRMGVEIESAALAAERRTGPTLKTIRAALSDIEATLGRGETAIDADFAFHSAIAEATGNSYYASLLGFLGRYIIPHQSVRLESLSAEKRSPYAALVREEHRRIYQAIADRDPAAARDAMRAHLGRSLERTRHAARGRRR